MNKRKKQTKKQQQGYKRETCHSLCCSLSTNCHDKTRSLRAERTTDRLSDHLCVEFTAGEVEDSQVIVESGEERMRYDAHMVLTRCVLQCVASAVH